MILPIYAAFVNDISTIQSQDNYRHKESSFSENKKEEFIIEDNVLISYTGNSPIVDIPDGVKIIGARAFYVPSAPDSDYGNKSAFLTEVHFPQSVQKIDSWAFQNCSGLVKITGAENVTEIGKYAFSYSGIKEINLPGVINIGDEAFSFADIAEIDLPNIESIGEMAFFCSGLKKLNGLEKLKNVGNSCFDGCPLTKDKQYSAQSPYYLVQKLQNGAENIFLVANGILFGVVGKCSGNLIIPDGVTDISAHIQGDFTSLVLPKSLLRIGEAAFMDNPKLRWVTMGNSVEEIGIRAFGNCSNLTEIRLSDSIRELGSYCFQGCSKLKSITLPASTKKVSRNTFPETVMTFICPSGLTNFDMRFTEHETSPYIDSLPFGQGTFYVPEVEEDSFLAGYAAGLRWKYLPIKLEVTELTLKVGEQYPLRLRGGAKAAWKTSNKAVATVGSTGDIYAKRAGNVTITATIYGKKYKCQVTVIKQGEAASTNVPTTPLPTDALPLNEEYFPDANFREYLSLCADRNHDGILSQKERDALISIRNTDEQPEMKEYEYNELDFDHPEFWCRFYLSRTSSFQGVEYFRHLKEFVLMDDTRGSGELFLAGDDLEIFMTNANFTTIHIENQEKLQHFELSVKDHADYLDLSGTQNLENLQIIGDVEYSFEVFARNEKLRRVWITCDKMAAEDTAYLNQMPNLEYLTIWGGANQPADVLDLSADTKLKKFIFSADSLSKLILPSEAVEISLSCESGYPEIVFSDSLHSAKEANPSESKEKEIHCAS
ncbi:MAG: leucine-rich repeat protein [Lachnospiraceae bacterium]|nr:leucine-rich repeat protein [Lachnospiraceae bacterium]